MPWTVTSTGGLGVFSFPQGPFLEPGIRIGTQFHLPCLSTPKKLLKIPLKKKLKGCGPLPTPHSPFRHFCPIHAPNREEPLYL